MRKILNTLLLPVQFLGLILVGISFLGVIVGGLLMECYFNGKKRR
jgi:hypothetical protein